METLSGHGEASTEMKDIVTEIYPEVRHVSLTLYARGLDRGNDVIHVVILLSDGTLRPLHLVKTNGFRTYEFDTNNWGLAIRDSGGSPISADYYATVTYPR